MATTTGSRIGIRSNALACSGCKKWRPQVYPRLPSQGEPGRQQLSNEIGAALKPEHISTIS